jgi:hypothetical protein
MISRKKPMNFSCPSGVLAMNQSIIGALAVVLGSLVGGASTIATAWFIQRVPGQRESVSAEIRRRELGVYRFINECSKLAMDAFSHILKNPGILMNTYALLNSIRPTSSDPVVDTVDQPIMSIVEQYFQPNLFIEKLHKMTALEFTDSLRELSVTCRQELRRLSRGMLLKPGKLCTPY